MDKYYKIYSQETNFLIDIQCMFTKCERCGRFGHDNEKCFSTCDINNNKLVINYNYVKENNNCFIL